MQDSVSLAHPGNVPPEPFNLQLTQKAGEPGPLPRWSEAAAGLTIAAFRALSCRSGAGKVLTEPAQCRCQSKAKPGEGSCKGPRRGPVPLPHAFLGDEWHSQEGISFAACSYPCNCKSSSLSSLFLPKSELYPGLGFGHGGPQHQAPRGGFRKSVTGVNASQSPGIFLPRYSRAQLLGLSAAKSPL